MYNSLTENNGLRGVTCTYTEALIWIRIIWRLAVCWAWGLPTKRQLPCFPLQCSIRPRVYARKRTTTPTWSSEFGNWMSALGFRIQVNNAKIRPGDEANYKYTVALHHMTKSLRNKHGYTHTCLPILVLTSLSSSRSLLLPTNTMWPSWVNCLA